MTAEFIAIVAVGLSLAGLMLRMGLHIDRRIDQLENRIVSLEQGMSELRERMARLEGLLEGLRDSIGRAVA